MSGLLGPVIDNKITAGTKITYNPDGTAQVSVSYVNKAGLPNVISCLITQTTGSTSGVNYQEGNLLLFLQNYPDQITAQINQKGELLLYLTSSDGTAFSIDVNQNLIYTTTS